MSNTVGAIVLGVTAVGSMSYMAYMTYNASGSLGTDSKSEATQQNVTVQMPRFNETINFTVLKTEDELKDILKEHRVVYDPTQISHSVLTKPGRCEVFMLISRVSQTVSDYDIMRCQHMLKLASSK